MNQRRECSDVLQPSLPSFAAGRQWGGKPNSSLGRVSHRGLLGGGLSLCLNPHNCLSLMDGLHLSEVC